MRGVTYNCECGNRIKVEGITISSIECDKYGKTLIRMWDKEDHRNYWVDSSEVYTK